jgi:hypothetical protein
MKISRRRKTNRRKRRADSRRPRCCAVLDAAPRRGRCRRRCCAVENAEPWRMLRRGGCIAVDKAVVDAARWRLLPRHLPIPPPSPQTTSPAAQIAAHATRSPPSRSGGGTRLTPSLSRGTAVSLRQSEMGNGSSSYSAADKWVR